MQKQWGTADYLKSLTGRHFRRVFQNCVIGGHPTCSSLSNWNIGPGIVDTERRPYIQVSMKCLGTPLQPHHISDRYSPLWLLHSPFGKSALKRSREDWVPPFPFHLLRFYNALQPGPGQLIRNQWKDHRAVLGFLLLPIEPANEPERNMLSPLFFNWDFSSPNMFFFSLERTWTRFSLKRSLKSWRMRSAMR